MLSNDDATSETASALPVDRFDALRHELLACAGSLLIRSIERREALEEVRDDVGVRGEELRWSPRGSSSRTGPSARGWPRSTRILPPLLLELGRVRLGHPRAVDRAGLERGERGGVVLRDDRDVAAAVVGGRVRPLTSARCAARRLGCCPSDGVAIFLPLRSAGARDRRLHDEERAARRGTGDDADQLAARLLVGVDRGVGPDERGVERIRRAVRWSRRCRSCRCSS